jgi:hypothetical protein
MDDGHIYPPFVRQVEGTSRRMRGLLLEYITLQSLRLMQTSRLCIMILINQVLEHLSMKLRVCWRKMELLL